jgi:hypothetical protein
VTETHPSPAEAPGADRREAERRGLASGVVCQLFAPCGPFPLTPLVLDISAHGVRLLSPCRFEPGTVLTLVMSGQTGPPCCTVAARVIYCVEREEGACILGATLLRGLTDDETRLLLK